MARVVVIGAGIGGLAAAARLHAGGHQVTVLEQAPTVGGKLGWLEARIRTEAGTLPLRHRPVAADDAAGASRPVRRHRRSARATLALTPARPDRALPVRRRHVEYDADELTDDPGWRRLMERAGRMWRATAGPFLEAPGPPSLLRLARRSPARPAAHRPAPQPARPSAGSTWTTRTAGCSWSATPPTRAATRAARPAVLATVPYAEQTFGGWYVEGGLHQLATALADRAGTVRTGVRVAAVETAGGRVAAVRLADGGRLAADVVVANADATALYRDLLPRPRLLPRGEPSLSGLVLLLGLSRHARPGLRHHTVLFPGPYPDAYDDEFDSVFAGRMPQRPDRLRVGAAGPRGRPARLRGLVRAGQRASARVRPRLPGLDRARRRATGGGPGARPAAERGLDVRDRIRTRDGADPGRPRATDRHARRSDLRLVRQRRPGRVPATGQPVTGRRAVPRRRVGASRRRATAGRAVRTARSSPTSIGPA